MTILRSQDEARVQSERRIDGTSLFVEAAFECSDRVRRERVDEAREL